ncbi:DeoR/GlpR family DNA-binding transcription regulator [uncultured Roseovarius sp.]|uniref:DeoR/GlpR family DNA-binding transcription regulator n=1 Tax=uncultured Roseovarius sp. TaxID=293344 RepID=UPI00261BB35E|nr:DeoR/GlpR family DNA-binding transcription regulator [uncultured Roseovarius sp.]
MSQTFRQPDILEIARAEGKVTVEGLAERFDVTVQTIRRDLTELANAGKLERVHGGAILPSGVSNILYEERRRLNEPAKQAIARACAAAIPDDASLFLDIGTTTEAVARELMDHRNLMVVTNNMNVAQILLANTDCEIVVAGGALRRSDNGLVGNLTARTIENFKFDYAILGCSAMDEDGDMLDFDIQEVVVGQTLLNRSREVFLAADHSKFQRSAPVRIGSLRDVDQMFTDTPLPAGLDEKCLAWGTQVHVADAAARLRPIRSAAQPT